MKQRMMEVVEEYKMKYCDKKGNIKNSNLTLEQKAGLKECHKLATSNEQVYYMTDKSCMNAVDTTENYIKSMRKHVEGDKKLSPTEVTSLERKMNGHGIMFTRFLRWDQDGSIKKESRKLLLQSVALFT